MQWDFPTPHIEQITVASSDIDEMGHTNNACYVVWCEDCAWAHSRKLGLSVADYRRLNRGVAIQHAEYHYELPSFVDDPLEIATWLVHCDGKLRLERRFQIRHKESGKTILRGHWRLICINLESGKAARFPTDFIEIYGSAVVSEANA